MSDLVNHPSHYEEQSIKLEPIDFCERLPFCEGNAIKYCFRAGHKDGASELLDLKKAEWYMNRRKQSPTKLKMSYTDHRNFSALVSYLSRSKGVLGEAARECLERWYMNRRKQSPTKLKMSYTDHRNFSALVSYLSRSKGVLGEAARECLERAWKDDPGEFWICLDIAIGLRIRELTEAKNDK